MSARICVTDCFRVFVFPLLGKPGALTGLGGLNAAGCGVYFKEDASAIEFASQRQTEPIFTETCIFLREVMNCNTQQFRHGLDLAIHQAYFSRMPTALTTSQTDEDTRGFCAIDDSKCHVSHPPSGQNVLPVSRIEYPSSIPFRHFADSYAQSSTR
jgi:hypothetical protein